MRRYLVVTFVGLCGLFLGPAHSAVAQSTSQTERTYELRGQILSDSKLIGAPIVRLKENQPAIITLEQDGGYSLKVVARESDTTSQHGRRLIVDSEVFLRKSGQWARIAAPRFTIPIGKAASFELDAPTRKDSASGYPFKMEITVTDASVTAQRKGGLLPNACSAKQIALWQSKMANAPLLRQANLATMIPPRSCCKDGNLTCCGEAGTCCWDGVSGNGCCVAA